MGTAWLFSAAHSTPRELEASSHDGPPAPPTAMAAARLRSTRRRSPSAETMVRASATEWWAMARRSLAAARCASMAGVPSPSARKARMRAASSAGPAAGASRDPGRRRRGAESWATENWSAANPTLLAGGEAAAGFLQTKRWDEYWGSEGAGAGSGAVRGGRGGCDLHDIHQRSKNYSCSLGSTEDHDLHALGFYR